MWRSSSVPITQKDLSSSRSAGWSNERSHGSGDAGVSPKIGRISTERRSHFCASLQSGSCSENYAILHDLSGQTLSDFPAASINRSIIGLGGFGYGMAHFPVLLCCSAQSRASAPSAQVGHAVVKVVKSARARSNLPERR